MQTPSEWTIIVAVLVLAVAALIAVVAARSYRRRHEELKRRFGPEYDREVEKRGSVRRAEQELIMREKRVQRRRLHVLPQAERLRFTADWRAVQARFVDDPAAAVQAADDLIKAVMIARGYAVDDFEQRVADLSVEHAGVVEHYRAASKLADANRQGQADTEELRQAVVHYRALFADLLEQPAHTSQQLQEVHP